MVKSLGTLRIKLILLRNVKLRAITKLENSTSETQFCLILTSVPIFDNLQIVTWGYITWQSFVINY